MMNSSAETSTDIRVRQRERPRLTFTPLFCNTIMQITKDSDKRTVNFSKISEPQPCVRSPVETKTETDSAESASSTKVVSQNSRKLNDKPYQKYTSHYEKYSIVNENELMCRSKNKSHSAKDVKNTQFHTPLGRKTEADDVKTISSPKVISQNSRILNNKSYQKCSWDSKKYSSYNENEFISRSKNKGYNEKDKKTQFNTHSTISDVINSPDEESDYIEFKEIKHNREFLSPHYDNFKISLKNCVPKTTAVTCISNSLPASNIIYVKQTPYRYIDFEKEQILSSGEDNYIPPPVMSASVNNAVVACNSQASSTMVSEKNEASALSNDNLVPIEDLSYSGDDVYFSHPDSDQIKAVTKFILTVVKEKSVSNSLADKVEQDLNAVIREHLEGYRIEVYGSYYSNLAITTSDINLVLISDCSVRKTFMFEIYKLLSEDLKLYSVYPYEDGSTAHNIKIKFSHTDTGITCQLAYLGKHKADVCKMGRFLYTISKYDERVKMLIIAAKIWSEGLCINEVDDGKLHPVGYALMVIHFLQHCENPILSNFPCDKSDIELLPPNNSTIGELWLAFLKYYAITFNWKRDVITIDSKEYVAKISKRWENYWIAIEDPFTEKNIAESVVNSDVAEHIMACFKSSYEYFCTPPDHAVINSADDEDESNGSSSCKWQFSFQQCIAEQSDVFCEDCDELMGVCDECQKKMYVQPMVSVPKMTDSFLKLVKDSLMTVYEKYMLSEDEINERKMFVKKLQDNVCTIYPDAELNLFGSSANGFGFKNSDLDICITFKSRKVINAASILKDLRSLLRKDRSFDHVIAIFSAKIPVIKFHHQHKGWRGDISLNNILAIHNSNLLHTYSLLDERCKILGCALKLLAKKALIAEVTEKALSSYSYLNMVIYFLQQTEPPVLPVLQDYEFRKSDFKIDHIVENCNVWFCDDLEHIKSIFKAENKTPVEQLWLDLLDYYCSYDYSKFISIRQKDPVYICANKRFARLFNIQDPFIETKNLGCVVSEKKTEETKSVLSRARQLFRTPVKELPTYVMDIEDFFFSTQSLTGRIHKEAHCDLCGKFGHEKQDCKQSQFPLQRYNYRRFAKQNMYKSRYPYRRPINRGPYRKQLPMNQ